MSRLRRALGASLVASLGIQLLNVVTGVLLARSLGPHARGELAAVILWPSVIAGLGSFGVAEALTYYAAAGRERAGSLVATGIAVATAQALALAAVGVGVVALVFHDASPDARAAAYAFLPFIPANLLALYLMGVFNGLQRFTLFQALRLGTIVLSAAAIIGLSVADSLTVRTASFAYLAATVVVAVGVVVLAVCSGFGRLRVDLGLARRLLRFGTRSHVGSVSSQLSERLDQLVISIFLAPVSLGLYVIAVTLTSLTTLVGTSVQSVALPALAGVPQHELPRLARRLLAGTIAVSAAISLALVFALPSLVSLFFGGAFLGAVDVARVLLVAAVVLSANRVLNAILIGAGRPLDAGIGEALGLGVTVVALAALLPAFGIVGAGVASLAAYLTAAAWMIYRASDLLAPEAPAPALVGGKA